MRKKLLLGSVLVLALLLLMPSIPAIQQNIVKEDIKDMVLSELSEDLDFKDIPEIKKLEQIRHLWLYFFVLSIIIFRLERISALAEISSEVVSGDWGTIITVNNYILFIRSIILFATTYYFSAFWQILSNKFGWNWDIINDLPYD